MDILKKKDCDRCVMDGFKLNQKVFFKRKNKKSRILAIDTSGDDSFKFFIEDEEGNFLKKYISGWGTKESLDKKGTWCTKKEISRITKSADDESFPFNIENHTQKALSLCAEKNDEKAKYFKYKDRVIFVKAVEGSDLSFSDENKLVEVEKESYAEAVVILFDEHASEMKHLYNTIIALNPDREGDILECIVNGLDNIEELMTNFYNCELIADYNTAGLIKYVLIKI